MKTALLNIIIAFCALCACSFGEDITTLNGKTYSNIKIQRVEPDGLTIMHSAGVNKLFFGELPEEVRTKYGADPAKAALYRQKLQLQQMNAEVGNAKRDAIKRIQAQAIMIKATVNMTTKEGIYLADALTPVVTTNKVHVYSSADVTEVKVSTKWVRVAPEGQSIFVIGGGGLYDGAVCEGIIYPAGLYQNGDWGNTVKCFTFSAEEAVARLMGK